MFEGTRWRCTGREIVYFARHTTITMEAANLPPHSTRMQSILEAVPIIIEDGDVTNPEEGEISTLTTSRTHVSGASVDDAALLAIGHLTKITDEEYKRSKTICRLYEENEKWSQSLI